MTDLHHRSDIRARLDALDRRARLARVERTRDVWQRERAAIWRAGLSWSLLWLVIVLFVLLVALWLL